MAILGATSTAAIHVLAIEPAGSIPRLSEVIVPVVLHGFAANNEIMSIEDTQGRQI